MTSGFEQQAPLTNNGFNRTAPCPRHVGVQLPREDKTPVVRPPERKTF